MHAEPDRIDPVRRRTVADGPEERVRQAFLRYLIEDRHIPRGLISVESGLTESTPGLRGVRRTDIVVHDRNGRPWMLVECKAADVPLDQRVFNQAAGYNQVLDARYVLVTNGRRHLCADLEDDSRTFLDSFPDYPGSSDDPTPQADATDE